MKKTSFAKIAGGLALLAVSSIAMASVVNTKHNLGASNSAGSNHTNNTTEICIFCHTPHGADQSSFAPLWNRSLGSSVNGGTASTSGVAYTRFSSLGRLTFDAKEAPIGSVSAACLSCHDGTQSMDAVINSPGSDSTGNVSSSTGGSYVMPASIAAYATNNGWSQGRSMGDTSFDPADGNWNGTYNPLTGKTRGDLVFLGTDLSNDHPISMQYGGGGISHTTPSGATTDPDFAQAVGRTGISGIIAGGKPGGLLNPDGTARVSLSNAALGNTTSNAPSNGSAATGVNGSGTGAVAYSAAFGASNAERWWIDTINTPAIYTSQDFPLYSRTDLAGPTNGTNQPTVECGTCHDPHSGNPTFLRLVGGNQSSQVCLTCHAK